MGAFNIPTIRFELDHMRQSLVALLNEQLVELDGEVRKAVDEAIKSFDYRGELHRITNGCIREAIQRAINEQFKYDGPGYAAIQNVASKLVKDAMKDAAGTKSVPIGLLRRFLQLQEISRDRGFIKPESEEMERIIAEISGIIK